MIIPNIWDYKSHVPVTINQSWSIFTCQIWKKSNVTRHMPEISAETQRWVDRVMWFFKGCSNASFELVSSSSNSSNSIWIVFSQHWRASLGLSWHWLENDYAIGQSWTCCNMIWHDLTRAGSNSFCLFLSRFVSGCLFLFFFCSFLYFSVVLWKQTPLGHTPLPHTLLS